MSFNIQRILDSVVKTLDRIINMLDIALNAFYKFLDYLIKTFEEVAKKILDLLTNLLRVVFYILPFIFMIIIGSQKNWFWMSITGWAVIIFVLVLFFRDFIAEIKGDNKTSSQNMPIQSKRAFIVILILNVLLISYSFIFYFVGISPEKYILEFITEAPANEKANEIREAEYLNIISAKNNTDFSSTISTISNLGLLKSSKASPILIEKLNGFIAKELNENETKEVTAIIEALENIGGEDACNSLVKFEVNCSNNDLVLKARKAANKICR
ncbi:MAG: hypothetical protein WCC06_08065 [Candidatus Aminicenantales bacterium]